MKITVGITTYNRKDYLIKMLDSLSRTQNIKKCNIRFFDDNSNEYDSDYLNQLCPYVIEVIRRQNNLGADGNMYHMFVDFLKFEDDILIVLDADLIVRSDWLLFLIENFKFSDGIISLYNSCSHNTYDEIEINNNIFCLKEHIGAAGVVMSRDIVKDIIDNIPSSRSFDWDWSRYLRGKGIRILVSKNSYFQHIGLHGYNSNIMAETDFALNFIPDNEPSLKYTIEFFENSLREKDENSINILNKGKDIIIKTLTYKIGYIISLPFRLLRKILKFGD